MNITMNGKPAGARKSPGGRFPALVSGLLLVLLAGSCDVPTVSYLGGLQGRQPNVTPEIFELTPKELTLSMAEGQRTGELKATVYDPELDAGTEIHWTSSNPEAVTVEPEVSVSGGTVVVTAQGLSSEPVTITATCGPHTAACTVTVTTEGQGEAGTATQTILVVRNLPSSLYNQVIMVGMKEKDGTAVAGGVSMDIIGGDDVHDDDKIYKVTIIKSGSETTELPFWDAVKYKRWAASSGGQPYTLGILIVPMEVFLGLSSGNTTFDFCYKNGVFDNHRIYDRVFPGGEKYVDFDWASPEAATTNRADLKLVVDKVLDATKNF
jgi:hypothetical protein